MEEPDFSIEVDSLEENEMMPKIIPRNVPLVEKPAVKLAEKPAVKPVEKPAVEMSINEPIVQNLEESPNQLAETIEIENPQSIFPHIEPYSETSPKQHHFQLKHKTDRAQLINTWNQIGITAELNESGKNNVDVTLTRQSQLVGKIQFLHFDRRDRSVRSKHYVKVYLYQFNDASMFEKTKQIMRDYFREIGSHPRKQGRSSRKQGRSSLKQGRSLRKTRRLPHKKVRSTRKHRYIARK